MKIMSLRPRGTASVGWSHLGGSGVLEARGHPSCSSLKVQLEGPLLLPATMGASPG